MSVALEARGLTKRYRRGDAEVTGVEGLDLRLDAGEFVALVGPSGCGKSTLLHLCGAMDRPTAGDVMLEGQSVGALDDDALTRLRRTRVGFVFQFFNLLPSLTVAENIALPLLLAGADAASITPRVRAWAERVGIAHRLDHVPSQLSGGEAQRTAIARAVVHEPVLLLADEPTGNLDSANGTRIVQLLRDVSRQSGAAILLATHDATVAATAHRVVTMRDGRIVGDDRRPSGAPAQALSPAARAPDGSPADAPAVAGGDTPAPTP